MKKLFALLLLVSLPTIAQAPAPVSRGDLLKNRQYQTAGDMTLFVDPLGNDGNACTGTTTSACLTIQGAINKVPKNVQHAVSITVAAGTYAAFQVTGFTFRYPLSPATASYMIIQGTFVTASPATGTATGTATAGTAGTTSPAVFGTLTDSGQTWTINNLRNKWIEITGGTGSGQVRPISSNTATVITTVGVWTAPVGASTTYAIRDQGTIINTALNTPNSPAITFTSGASVWAYDNVNDSVNSNGTNLEIKRMWAQPPTPSVGFSVSGSNRTYLRELQATALSTGTPFQFFGDATSAVLTEAIALPAAGATGVAIVTTGRMTSSIVVRRTRVSGGAASVFAFGGVAFTQITQNEFDASTSSAFGMGSGSGAVTCQGCDGNIISCASGTGINVPVSPISGRPFFWNGSGTSISNCGTAILLTNRAQLITAGVWTGSSNTTAFNVSTGSDLQISSGSTLTGTTEINIDGDTYTLTEFRAFSPVLISNPYGTVVRQ